MLNLNKPVQYTKEEQRHVDAVLKPLLSDGWKDQKQKTHALKHDIDTYTIRAQGGRCAYCETILRKGAHAIDHIAPKGIYGEFCYEPFNLVNACSSCNSTSNKGEKDIIEAPADKNNYTNNRFTIVHPYFDNPDEHIKYEDDDKTIYDMPNCSRKGLETISTFHWDESWAYTQRVINAMTRDLPIDVAQLIMEISTYK